MYGLIIESIVAFIRKRFGEEKWQEIRRLGKIEQHSFSTHLIYPETTIPRLVETAADVLRISREDLLTQFGDFFVTFVSQYGYDKILRVLGRHMRDFLNGLDNLHEYMRFSYPKLKPPSFFVEKESEHGLILHYRSKRRYGGYVRYVIGQIKSVGKAFYGLDIDIELLKEEFVGNAVHVTMQLRFDNSAFLSEAMTTQDILDDLRLESEIFFEAFPFHILFTEDMIIKSAGHGLSNVMPTIEGYDITHMFALKRPMVEFVWEQVMSHTNNVFELESVDSVQKKYEVTLSDGEIDDPESSPNEDSSSDLTGGDAHDGKKLHLKGQMIWVPEWQGTLFLGTPVLPHLSAMFETGLFINDLSLHDNSRDLVLAGTQTSAELKLALDLEQIKSRKLEDSMKKLDEEMRRTDELLYQMIPKQIADRLRAGEPALDTCQVFNDVTILFSDVVGFTTICSRISPLQVVTMLNMMYSKFDQLCSLNDVYKVETIGDAYVVVSGAPEEVSDHAERIADMAVGMIEGMEELVDPSTGNHLQIRVGINSGIVVAGVVGLKMPRYCLFGDTVNTAAKMEATSEHMKIQLTESTRRHLEGNSKYNITFRGLVDVKDKGKLNTYWLNKSYESLKRPRILLSHPRNPSPTEISASATRNDAPIKRSSIQDSPRINSINFKELNERCDEKKSNTSLNRAHLEQEKILPRYKSADTNELTRSNQNLNEVQKYVISPRTSNTNDPWILEMQSDTSGTKVNVKLPPSAKGNMQKERRSSVTKKAERPTKFINGESHNEVSSARAKNNQEKIGHGTSVTCGTSPLTSPETQTSLAGHEKKPIASASQGSSKNLQSAEHLNKTLIENMSGKENISTVSPDVVMPNLKPHETLPQEVPESSTKMSLNLSASHEKYLADKLTLSDSSVSTDLSDSRRTLDVTVTKSDGQNAVISPQADKSTYVRRRSALRRLRSKSFQLPPSHKKEAEVTIEGDAASHSKGTSAGTSVLDAPQTNGGMTILEVHSSSQKNGTASKVSKKNVIPHDFVPSMASDESDPKAAETRRGSKGHFKLTSGGDLTLKEKLAESDSLPLRKSSISPRGCHSKICSIV